MIAFNDYIHKYNLKSKTKSNKKIQQILSSLSLSDVGIYLRDGPFETGTEIISLHPFHCTDWVLYIDECYFDSYGYTPRNTLS